MGRFDNYLSARVTYRKDIGRDLMIIRLQPETAISFVPGQFCTLAIDGITRPYSMASSPGEDALEFFVERVPEGKLTTRIWALQVGDEVRMLPRAKGRFLFENIYKNHLMVSTVAGVAPFISMIRDLNERRLLNSYQITLFQGASYADEFGYIDELSDLCRRGLVVYIPALSRPADPRNQNWTGKTGKVNQALIQFLEDTTCSPQDTLIYACGHPGMIRAVAQEAEARGYRCKEEKYFVLHSRD